MTCNGSVCSPATPHDTPPGTGQLPHGPPRPHGQRLTSSWAKLHLLDLTSTSGVLGAPCLRSRGSIRFEENEAHACTASIMASRRSLRFLRRLVRRDLGPPVGSLGSWMPSKLRREFSLVRAGKGRAARRRSRMHKLRLGLPMLYMGEAFESAN